jgi:hypothetical protein
MPRSSEFTDLLTLFRARQHLYARLTQPSTATDPTRPLVEQPLLAQIKLFERIAAGRITRTKADAALVQQVEAAVEQLLHVLLHFARGWYPYVGTSRCR